MICSFFSHRDFLYQTTWILNEERERSNRANGGRMRWSCVEEMEKVMERDKENEEVEEGRSGDGE
jgi:hypothetical protein